MGGQVELILCTGNLDTEQLEASQRRNRAGDDHGKLDPGAGPAGRGRRADVRGAREILDSGATAAAAAAAAESGGGGSGLQHAVAAGEGGLQREHFGVQLVLSHAWRPHRQEARDRPLNQWGEQDGDRVGSPTPRYDVPHKMPKI